MRMYRKIRLLPRQVLAQGLLAAGLLLPLAGDQLLSLARPAPAPKPESLQINPDDWKSLAGTIEQRARRYRGHAAYIVKDFQSGHLATLNEGDLFPSASLIKIPILCAAFQAVEDRRMSLSAPVALKRSDRRGGSGILKFMPAGTVLSNRELLEAMIIHSDNTATDLIVQQLGYDYLQTTFAQLGLRDTTITPEGFRLTSRRIPQDNMTSPRDMAYLLEKIYRRELVSADASDQMLDILKNQKLRDRLPRYLPQGWEIAHKTGLLRRACHDVGIVFSPKGDYLVCVLTARDRTYKNAKQFIASIGRITFDYYRHDFQPPVLHSRAGARPATRSS